MKRSYPAVKSLNLLFLLWAQATQTSAAIAKKTKREEKNVRVKKLKTKLETLQKANHHQKGQISNLITKNEQLQKNNATQRYLQKSLQKKMEQKNELISRLKDKNHQLHKQKEKLISKTNYYKRQQARLDTRYNQVKKEEPFLYHKEKTLDDKEKRLKARSEALTEEMRKIKEERDAWKQEIKNLIQDYEELHQRTKKLSKILKNEKNIVSTERAERAVTNDASESPITTEPKMSPNNEDQTLSFNQTNEEEATVANKAEEKYIKESLYLQHVEEIGKELAARLQDIKNIDDEVVNAIYDQIKMKLGNKGLSKLDSYQKVNEVLQVLAKALEEQRVPQKTVEQLIKKLLNKFEEEHSSEEK
ncbi:MAG: hypothetical protein AAF335_00755 [Bacteroidota bacterium]